VRQDDKNWRRRESNRQGLGSRVASQAGGVVVLEISPKLAESRQRDTTTFGASWAGFHRVFFESSEVHKQTSGIGFPRFFLGDLGGSKTTQPNPFLAVVFFGAFAVKKKTKTPFPPWFFWTVRGEKKKPQGSASSVLFFGTLEVKKKNLKVLRFFFSL
jgi:hypothetical protein